MNQQSRKYSKKREAILDAIRSTHEHPSAERIYNCLKPLYPDLSLGTVYRNLNLFREMGEVVSIGSVGGQERFDGNVQPHPHFICTCCHRVIDLDLAFSANDHYADIEKVTGGVVKSECVSFMGLCDQCANTRDLPHASNT